MKLFLSTAFACLALAGCNTISTLSNVSGPSLKAVYEARAAYDVAFLAPAATYRTLPDCGGAAWTLASPCSDKAVIAKLRATDVKAVAAFDAAKAFAEVHPGALGLSGLIDAAKLAGATAIAVLAPYSPK